MNSRVLHPADQICTILRRIYDGDMTTLTGGNLSMRDEEGVVWVSPTGIDKSALTREDIVRIMPDGSIEGKHMPTSEYRIHWQILMRRPDLKAVLHAHPPALVTMSATHEVPKTKMLYQTYAAVGFPELAEYGFPGTLKLVECVTAAFDKGCKAAILKNHGVFLGCNIDLYDAFINFEQLDFHARIELFSGILGEGKEPEQQEMEKFQKELKTRMEKGVFQSFFPHDYYGTRELELRRELKEFARRACRKRLFTGGFGTISAKISEDEFLISPLKKDNAFLVEEDFVLIRKGECEEGKHPDMFAEHHRDIYRKHPDIGSIIMAAPVYASAYAMTDREYEVGVIPESYGVLRNCRRVPMAEINNNWARIAEESGMEHPFCILENLGVLVMGATPLMAFDKLEVAESTAMTIHMACTGHRKIKAMTEAMKKEQDEQN